MVLLDITAPRQEAVQAAVRLAQQEPATVELYDCGLGGAFLAPGWADADDLKFQYRALLRERRLADLERLARPLRSCGLDVTTVSEDNSPLDTAIARHIEHMAPDVIVKDGASARADSGGWQVQTDVILKRHARCAVLLVGEARLDENAGVAAVAAHRERA